MSKRNEPSDAWPLLLLLLEGKGAERWADWQRPPTCVAKCHEREVHSHICPWAHVCGGDGATCACGEEGACRHAGGVS